MNRLSSYTGTPGTIILHHQIRKFIRLVVVVWIVVVVVGIPITITAIGAGSSSSSNTNTNTEVYGVKGQSISFSWTVNCGLLGQETTSTFRIIAHVDNVTTDNDEYSIHYDEDWDVRNIATTGTTNSTSTTLLSTTTHGGYKIGQKKVIQFRHMYMEQNSYHTTFTATVIAPNHPSIHGVQHTANYTIVISDLLCLATAGTSTSTSNSIPSNIFTNTVNDGDDDDMMLSPSPLPPSNGNNNNIDLENASSNEITSSTTRTTVSIGWIVVIMPILTVIF